MVPENIFKDQMMTGDPDTQQKLDPNRKGKEKKSTRGLLSTMTGCQNLAFSILGLAYV